MNFSSAQKVLQTITAGDEVEFVRGSNRTKVLEAANCVPPLDEQTAEELGIKINVNWGELMVLLSHARSQLLSAFLSNQYFFTVKLPLAPKEHQSEWESFITQEVNRPLRESLQFFELHRSKWSSVVCHGVGPMVWKRDDHWLPQFKAMSDVRIPTDTTLDFYNLPWYATRELYTPINLIDEVFNNRSNNHWDKKAIAKLLKTYKELNVTDAQNNYDWETSPEKLVELMKQNGGFYGSDAVPTINLWHFYFEDTDDDGKKGWYLRVVPETGVTKTSNEDFLWQSETPVAANWKELIHCQYGDLSTDAPFKYHAVRGLGYALLEPTFYTNLTRCRLLQHTHDNFNIWLRTSDPADKARAAIQEFGNLGMLRTGITVVPQTERHQIDANLVEMAMAQLKQLQGEASSAYTQQTDTGTKKEQTAFETRVKTEQVNAMMSGILMVAFKYESFAYREICRRFCLSQSTDPDIMKFRNRCLATGIPKDWLNVDHWEIEPVTPLGMGNPTIAQAAQQQLMQLRGMLNPQAQNEVLHEAILTITKDARKAARWAPLDAKPTQSDAKREAIGFFGTLMTGVPFPVSESNLIDQIDALLPLLAGKITMITKRDNMATVDEGVGLQNTAGYVEKAVQQLSQDEQAKDKVKQYGDALGKLNNEIKALIQRGAQARQKQNGNGAGAELNGKLQAEQITAKARARASDVSTAQKLHHRDMEFRQKQQLENKAAAEEQRRKNAEAFSEITRKGAKTVAEVHHNRLRSLDDNTEK